MSALTHVSRKGRPHMVDVSAKPPMKRVATAVGRISLNQVARTQVANDQNKKGAVLTTCELAGISAAKRTYELIPLCHPLGLTKVEVAATLDDEGVSVVATAATVAATGVEMEALTAVQVALLTVYDMCKAVDKGMRMTDVHLVEKRKEPLTQ